MDGAQILVNLALLGFLGALVGPLGKKKSVLFNQIALASFIAGAFFISLSLVFDLTRNQFYAPVALAAFCSVGSLFFLGYFRAKALLVLMAPICMLFIFLSIFAGARGTFSFDGPLALVLKGHILLAILGQCCAVFAMIVGGLYILQERALKSRSLDRLISNLPALDTLRAMLHGLLWFGFGLMGFAVLSGAFMVQLDSELMGLSQKYKVVWALAVWFWYMFVLFNVKFFEKPTSFIAQLSFCGFFLLSLGFFGSMY